MSEELEFTDTDLTNIARGFDAPAKADHLELLKQQAREREQEMEQEQSHNPFSDLQRKEKEQDELER